MLFKFALFFPFVEETRAFFFFFLLKAARFIIYISIFQMCDGVSNFAKRNIFEFKYHDINI